MRRRSRDERRPVEERTIVLSAPVHAWEKLAWNVDQFSDLQRSGNQEIQPMCYAFIDVCIAAWSLQEWVKNSLPKAEWDKLKQRVYSTVPAQEMCCSIANSAKHANYAGEWSGIMGLRFLPNDEDVEGGWIVMHQEGTETTWTTLSVVDSLPRDWHSFLSENSYIPEGYKGPEWFQNKMDRIFGPRID